jgi:tripartite-type tricarboxylate transporter receptor subunit TctC
MRKRHAFLGFLIPFCLACGAAPAADDYPNRSIRIVTPANPGGTTDFLARVLAPHLSKVWGTLFIPYHQHTVNAALIANLPYHAVNDFTAISLMIEGGLLLVVHPSHPAKTAQDFLKWVKTTKDPINFGSAGIGSGGHLAGELLALMTGVKMQHIPYKGTGPAAIALLGGEYHYNFMGLTGAFGLARAGKLRGLAVSSTKRVETAPDIPAFSEVLPGFEVMGWYGVTAPAKMPRPLVQKIHAAVVSLVKSPEFIKLMRDNGSEAKYNSPEEFRQYQLNDMKKWADVVKRAGIQMQ